RQLEVGRLTQRAMRADFNTVAAENAAVQRKVVAHQLALGHHQRASGADLHTSTAGDAVSREERDVEGRLDDGVKAAAKHAIAVRADDVVTYPDALSAVDALVGVAQDEAVRQVEGVVVVIVRLAVVEAIVYQAIFDAVFLQVALASGRAGALEATPRLALRLLLGVAQLDEAEVAAAVLIGQHRHLDLWLDGLVGHDVEEVGLALLGLDALGDLCHVLAAQVGVHSAGGELALGHALDDGRGTKLAISASEDTRSGGHKAIGIRLDGGALGPFDARLRWQHLLVRLLADGRDQRVAGDDILTAGNGHRAATARGVRLTKLHALELDAGNAPLLVADDAHGGSEELEIGALVLAVFHLLEGSSHLFAAAAVDGVDLGAEAQRGAGAVESGEAAADNDHLFGI